MHLKGNDYSLTVDYHSKFIEVWKATNKNTEAVISTLKQNFWVHRITKYLHSYNRNIGFSS